jgi:hypothetical protein
MEINKKQVLGSGQVGAVLRTGDPNYKENKGKSGVYRFINKANGKQYIGSAKNLKARFAHYYSNKSIEGDNMPICKAMLKYGRSFFIIAPQLLEVWASCAVGVPPAPNLAGGLDPYLGRYVFERVDKLNFSSAKVRSTILKIEASLAKIDSKIIYLRDKLAQLNDSSYTAKVSTRSVSKAGTFSTFKVADSKFKVLDLETNVLTYYKSIRQVARTLSCGHGAIQYSLNNPSARAYKGRYLITKISNE